MEALLSNSVAGSSASSSLSDLSIADSGHSLDSGCLCSGSCQSQMDQSGATSSVIQSKSCGNDQSDFGIQTSNSFLDRRKPDLSVIDF